ncbi:MAG: hypothetical protein V7637_6168 [Mycobacteriales bacterium]|jgi:hypothetical protein
MRRLTKTAAALMIAGASALTVAEPASANGSLVNVVVQDVGSNNQIVILQNVAVVLAAIFCNINVNLLSDQLNKEGKGSCPALTDITQIGKVVYS